MCWVVKDGLVKSTISTHHGGETWPGRVRKGGRRRMSLLQVNWFSLGFCSLSLLLLMAVSVNMTCMYLSLVLVICISCRALLRDTTIVYFSIHKSLNSFGKNVSSDFPPSNYRVLLHSVHAEYALCPGRQLKAIHAGTAKYMFAVQCHS